MYNSIERNGDFLNVLVTGASGQLGFNCVDEVIQRGYNVTGCGTTENDSIFHFPYIKLDISKHQLAVNIVNTIRPDAIIHCAAWTNVDGAEDNIPTVDAVNHLGTQYLAEAAKAVDAKMIYISTDYVFDGTGTRPWKPNDHSFAPLNVYGQSKLDGELAVSSILEKFFIVRTSWVFGLNGKNFVKTMVNVGRTHDTVRVVNDQIGRPTYTKDLARLLVDMVETDKYGYYHATGCTKFSLVFT